MRLKLKKISQYPTRHAEEKRDLNIETGNIADMKMEDALDSNTQTSLRTSSAELQVNRQQPWIHKERRQNIRMRERRAKPRSEQKTKNISFLEGCWTDQIGPLWIKLLG